MRLFIDSANPNHWEAWAEMGLIYGVTTNPLIFQRDEVALTESSCLDLIWAAQEMGLKEIQFQVYGLDQPTFAAARVRKLYDAWPEGVVAKVPLSQSGLATLQHLPQEIPLTLTAAYAPKQAIIALARGARYIAPYFGRLLDQQECPEQLEAENAVESMHYICQGTQTQVLMASLRTPQQVAMFAERGILCQTLPPALFDQLIDVDLTEAAVDQFEKAAKR